MPGLPSARGRLRTVPRGRVRAPRAGWLASTRVRLSILGLAVAAALLGGGWLWFQDSTFVAVEHVTVTGVRGPDAGPIRAALGSAARSMTTLDVQINRLYAAVSSFPVVNRLEVSTQFPHGMRIHVVEQLPVAEVEVDGRNVGVAADGTLLHDLGSLPTLPRIQLPVPPGGPRLAEPAALRALAAASAAPRALLPRISDITTSPQHGLVARLRGGPVVYLGDSGGLRSKWYALLAVLSDPGSAGASYIDVTDPSRPAAGAGGSGAPSGAGAGAAAGASTAAGTTSSTLPGGG